MQTFKTLLSIPFFLFFFTTAPAQDGGKIFSKITPSDFNIEKSKLDTTAGAIILADVGKSHFEGNSEGWFTLYFKRKKRILILDKKAFDVATVKIFLYKSEESEEKIESLKASTYNLENGKVVETDLKSENVFKEKYDENHNIKKFTLPAVKEGSIIEYTYTVKSDFLFNLQPWAFQDAYPSKWSEYNVRIPSFFEYVTLSQGYIPFTSKDVKTSLTNYLLRIRGKADLAEKDDLISLDSYDQVVKWVMNDIPALKEEKFTSSIHNHIAKIEFQLSAYNFPNSQYEKVMGTWDMVSGNLMKRSDFGSGLKNVNWVKNESGLISPGKNDLNEAVRIYQYVQKNIKNKGIHGIYLSQTLKETFKNKNGYVADINMLLTALLQHQGFTANPVILSTRNNGIASTTYPLLQQYNYVLCKLKVDSSIYYLDASQMHLGFGKLPVYCFNGAGRSIADINSIEYFSPEKNVEKKITNVNLRLDENNKKNWTGLLQSMHGYNESTDYRELITQQGEQAFSEKIKNNFTDYKIGDVELKDLKDCDKPLTVTYKIDISNNNEDIIYFNPMMKEGINENYFKSGTRLYPVEIPYLIDESYYLNIKIPEGYIVDEMPKSERVNLNETEASFEYIINRSDSEIGLRTSVKFNKAVFTNDDYEMLRSFFAHIVKKHAEQIVFKKKAQ